jgi:hypothetical protein
LTKLVEEVVVIWLFSLPPLPLSRERVGVRVFLLGRLQAARSNVRKRPSPGLSREGGRGEKRPSPTRPPS